MDEYLHLLKQFEMNKLELASLYEYKALLAEHELKQIKSNSPS